MPESMDTLAHLKRNRRPKAYEQEPVRIHAPEPLPPTRTRDEAPPRREKPEGSHVVVIDIS